MQLLVFLCSVFHGIIGTGTIDPLVKIGRKTCFYSVSSSYYFVDFYQVSLVLIRTSRCPSCDKIGPLSFVEQGADKLWYDRMGQYFQTLFFSHSFRIGSDMSRVLGAVDSIKSFSLSVFLSLVIFADVPRR